MSRSSSPLGGLRALWLRPWDLIGLTLALAYALPAFLYPHGNDQGLHAYIGRGILLGQLPFESGVSGKPVGIFVVHALATVLFGDTQWAIRVLEALTLSAMAPLLVRFLRVPSAGKPERDGEVGAAALVLFGLHYTFFDYWDISHPETWMGFCLLFSAVLAVHEGPQSGRRVAVIGGLCAAAFMLKYTAAVPALPIAATCGLRAVLAVPRAPTPIIRALLRSATQYLAGVALVFALCVAPFAVGGALEPMWEVMYTLTTRYIKQAPGVPYTAQWTRWAVGMPALLASGLALTVGLVAALRRGATAQLARMGLLLAITLATLLTVWLQNRFFSYHFMLAVPWLAGCILVGLRSAAGGHPRIQVGAALLLLVSAFTYEPKWCSNRHMSYADHAARARAYLTGALTRRDYLKAFTGQNYLDHYRVHEHIGLEIKRRAKPGDQLCVRGFAPAVYQVSGLRCPSRHVIQVWPAGLPTWEAEFRRTLIAEKPRFIVTFADRPIEVRRLQTMGYRPADMPSIYLLMDLEGPPGHYEPPKPRRARGRRGRPRPAPH